MERFAGAKVLITGGLGFIGSNLAVSLIQKDAKVFILDHEISRKQNIKGDMDDITLVKGDICDAEAMKRSVKGMDIIFHLAGQTSNVSSMEDPKRDVRLNLVGSMNVLSACRQENPGAKVVFSGTVTQHGKPKVLPFSEGMKDTPTSIYETNKLVAEKYMRIYAKAYGIDTVTLRFPTLFGERQRLDSPRFGITNYFIGRILKGEEITVYGDGHYYRDYLHISNVVDALMLVCEDRTDGEVYALGSGKKTLFIDMVKAVIDAVREVSGMDGSYRFVDFPKTQGNIDVGDTFIDYSKIRERLGWMPKTDLEEGLRKTVRFYLEHRGDYAL